jgi:ATP-dependent exoDNAse (exonuclease V) alpha subunit
MNFLDLIEDKPIEIVNQVVYDNFRNGDRVRIIRSNKSNLNIYKGYIGEIRDYKKGQEFALVFLYAINYPTTVKFPVNHFVKIE